MSQGDIERQVEAVAEDYLARLRAGQAPAKQDLVAAHPYLGEMLQRRLELVELLFRLAAERQAAADRVTAAASEATIAGRAAARRQTVRFADYEILGELGRGGMGRVYRARQRSLNRLVALKVILSGASAEAEELIRFRIEAEAIASLQHPNIVQVHEVGEEEGIPYLVLELVEGGSLDRLLAQGLPPARAAAELVETLAGAMHHAHQRGIVHRDLKPANVLLASGGREPAGYEVQPAGSRPPLAGCVPKITDFGIAKRWQEREAGPAATTGMLGTPCYMAPEQADGRPHAITPATDVYGLGGILYEMLTGAPAFQGETSLATIQQVLDADPVPPSRLRPGVPRDLETICLKCLQKEPARRYASALELADDLGRFLRGEPIRARPVGVVERLVKWVRRKPGWAAVVVAATLSLAVGTAGVVRYNVLLRKARDRAEYSLEHMILAVDTMLREVGEEQLAYEPRMEEKRRALLEKARAIFREVLEEHGEDPRLRESAALASRGLGDVLRLLGQHDQAAAAYREAIDLFGKLDPEQRGRAEVRRALADCYNFLGEALRLGGGAAARKPYDNALALLDGLIAESAEPGYRQDRARTLNNVGLLLRETGDPAGAKEKLEQAVAVLGELPASPPTRQHLARAHLNLGTVLHDLRQYGPAREHFGEARTILMDLARRIPESADYRHELAAAHNNRANLLGNSQLARQAGPRPARLPDRLAATWADYWGWREALDEHEEARLHFRALAQDFPRVPAYRAELANTHNSLGRVYLELNDLAGAEREWGESQRLLDELMAGPHAQSTYRRHLGQVLGNLGLVAFRRDRKPEAARLFERAAELLEEASRQMAGHPDLGRLLCTQYQRLAWTHLQLGNPREARRAARKLANADAASPRDVYNAACFLGRCATATTGELRRECAAEALVMLRNARDLGFRAARLPEEDAFDALAHEEEFRRLKREITKL